MKHKKTAVLTLALVLVLGLCGCAQREPHANPTEPTPSTSGVSSTTEPTEQSTFTVDKDAFQDLLLQIEEQINSEEDGPWESYSIRITGLCTPVILELEQLDVRSVTAYGRTVQADFYSDEGCIDISVEEYDQELIILGGSNNAWIVAPDWEYTFLPEDGVSIYPYVDAMGQLSYIRQADYVEWSEQYATAVLDAVSSRGALYWERGSLTFRNGEPSFTVESRQTVSDVCDLDALFAAAKALGWADYEQYDSADDVLAANKERGIEYPSYPVEPRSIAQTENYQGLTLELPTGFEVDTEAQNALVLNSETASIQVLTGSVSDHFFDLEQPVTPERLVECELQYFPEAKIGDYKGIPCLISEGFVSTYYISGDQWWLVEATGSFEDELVTLACCGSIQ